MFTIVTVTRNNSVEAAMTAQTVLDQDFDDYEYLVKDGASADDTVERLTAMGARLVTCVDSGVYDAMNQALDLAQGRYVCFMNSGDRFSSPDVLSAVARALRDHGFPSFCFGDTLSWDGLKPDANEIAPAGARPICYRNALSPFYLYRRTICHQAWFVDRELYRKLGGFDLSLSISSAYDFQLRALLVEKASYLHVEKCVVTYEGGGISGSNSQVMRQDRRNIIQRHFSLRQRLLYSCAFAVLYGFSRLARPLIIRFAPKHLKAIFFGH
ncbi:MAG: glycosyltransferase family 2 protein [Limisphaerales bacterium]